MANIVLLAALKVFPLSDRILIGIPLRAVNLLKLRKNACDVSSTTRSRCTARMTQHVYKQIQTFLEFEFRVSLTCIKGSSEIYASV